MWAFFSIMLAQPRVEVARDPAVMRFFVSFADEDVNVVESVHQAALSEKKAGLPSRSLGALRREPGETEPAYALLRRGSLAFRYAPSEGWRQGDSNP